MLVILLVAFLYEIVNFF